MAMDGTCTEAPCALWRIESDVCPARQNMSGAKARNLSDV